MENLTNAPYVKYAKDIVGNKIVACENVRNACQRFLNDLDRDDLEFRKDVADRAINFIGILKHFKGKSSGQPFILEPFQTFIVANLTGWYWKETGDRRFTSAYIEMARKGGKALSLDTPIPTPNGWTTMGEIKVGDYVWGADGKPTKVTFATEVMHNHKCYKIQFADGEEVVADAEHNWCITKRGMKNKCQVMTTEQIKNSVWKRARTDGKGNEYIFRIPVNKPTHSDDIDLPVDPYTLGCWLADGHLHKPNISTADFDVEMYERVSAIYGEPKLYHDKRTRAITLKYTGEKGRDNSKLRHALADAGVLHFKHIPEIYLRAGTQQRWDLLRGFMDCDGYVDKNRGQCEFIQKSIEVTDGICELLSTLGITYSRTTKIPTLNGKKCDMVQRVQFFTDKNHPCFSLPRKFERLKDHLNQRMEFKSIVNIEPVESVPVRCITVDNDDHLYLFGKRYSVTHNTALIASLAMYYFIADGEDGAEVDIAANNFEQAKICFEFIQQYCKQLDPQQRDLKVYRSSIELPCTASKINVFSADASGKDGFNASVGIIDEYHSAKTTGMRDIIKSSMGMRRDPMLLTITSAGFDKSLPCYKLRTTCIEILSGLKTDDSTFAIIYGLDEGDDWTDEKVWIKSNPNLERTVTTKYLREQVTSAINNPTEEVSVRTKNLGQWLSTSSVWIPDTYINKCTKTINLDDFNEDSECWVGVDLASVGDMTAVTFMLFNEDDETPYFHTKYYLPETALVESPNRELYKHWSRTGDLTVCSGNVTDYDYITNDIMAMYNRFMIRKVAFDSWNSVQWAIRATELGLPLEPYSQSIGNFNKPTREFERLIRQGKCVIDNNEITRWMFRNVAIKTDTNGNIKPNKGAGAEKKIDGIISQITALGKWLETPRFSGSILAL